jgi:hypothetical protein
MRYRKLDQNGDMVFGNQQKDFYRDVPEAVAQACLTRLRLFTSEWFLDVEEGTPYQQAVLGTNKSKTFDPAIRSRILETEGLSSIDSLDSVVDGESRSVRINGNVSTIYGQANIQGIL